MKALWNIILISFFLFVISVSSSSSQTAERSIVIGLNLPLSGAREAEGLISRQGAELAATIINAQGGVKVNDTLYTVQYAYRDNKSSASESVAASIGLISKDQVVAVIGPIASSTAIPAGNICQSFKTPMISPTSTNPKTTAGRDFVFRAIALDTFQAEVLADFAISEFQAKKAAVLYNIGSAYPKGLAEYFKASFESRNGPNSVVAFENFLSNEKDLSQQLKRIVASDADVLLVPQYANEIPSIVRQARAMGWTKTIFGGDGWESADLVANCGDLCKGLYYGSHYSPDDTVGKEKEFVDAFQKQTGRLPNFYAALSYDAVNLLLTAISHLSVIDDNLVKTREMIKDQLAKIQDFMGVAGTMHMNKEGDPTKGAVIMKITDTGKLVAYKRIQP